MLWRSIPDTNGTGRDTAADLEVLFLGGISIMEPLSDTRGYPYVKEFVIRRYRPDQMPQDGRQTLLRIDDEGTVVQVDHHAEAVLGYEAGELVGQPVHRILASRQDDPFAPANRHQIEDGQHILVTFRHRDGFFFTAQLSLKQAIHDSDQAARATIALADAARVDPCLLKSAENLARFGLWELDIASNEMTWSEGIYQLLELRPGLDITPEQALFYCQARQSRVRAMFRRCIRTGQPFSLELNVLTARQKQRRMALEGRALRKRGRIHRLVGTLVDRTAIMEQEKALDHCHRLMEATGQATPDLVAAVDTRLTLLHCNQSYASQFAQTFGKTPRAGDNLRELLREHPNERRLIERLWQRAFERGSFMVEMPLAHQNRDLPVHEFHYQRLTSAQGDILGAVHVGRNTHTRISQNEAGDRIRRDPVTGLMNRREFFARLLRTLEQKSHRDSIDSLLYLDLDDFNRFNETAGSGTCDRYLRELAGNLGVRIRQRDALARLSGDTFVLLIENCPEPRARKIADDIRELVRSFVFEWQGSKLQTTVSGGLLVIENEFPNDPEKLLTQAADLCHTAKTSGRNRIHTARAIASSMDEDLIARRLDQIREALDNDRLLLEYQALKPVASATWGDHIEILCRIPALRDGQIQLQPDQFLPVTERFDLAKRLDRQVIRQTLDWLSQHKLLEPRIKYCGFNLSITSVLDDTFPDFLEAELANSPFSPEYFCLEIREEHATQYPDDVAILCDALHKIGCRVALEGAGASVESYSLAAKLPVDIIKLDRRMMEKLEEDPVQQVMVEALHRIAEAAGKTTVATHIESDHTLRRVRTLGIHFGQGSHLEDPRPLEDLTPTVVGLSSGHPGG